MSADDEDWKLITQELGSLHSRVNETERKVDGLITGIKVIAIIVFIGGGLYWLGGVI